MKIAINMVATSLGSGTRTYNINFCNEIVNNKNIKNQLYIYLCKNYLKYINKKILNHPKIKVVVKPDFLSNSFLRLIWTQLILPIEIKFKKINTLFSPMNIAPLFIKIFNIKSILALHSNLPWNFFHLMPGNFIKKILIRKMMYYSILSSDKLIVDSNYAKKEIVNILKINNKNIKVIYLGIDKKFYAKNNYFFLNNIDYAQPYILSVLSCVKYHNIINILKAFRLVDSLKKTEISLVLVMQILDKEYFEQINYFIKNNNLTNQVIIIKNLEGKYLLNLYKNAKIYIFSSYSEVFGYTTIEAMASGCPVLVSKKSCLPEINNNAAEYFNPDIISSIAKKILILLNKKELRNKLITKGFKHAKKFSIKKTFLKTFHEINV